MEWITENWFWVLIFIAFMAMHMFGHGGHGGHGGSNPQRNQDQTGKDDGQGRVVSPSPSGHRH